MDTTLLVDPHVDTLEKMFDELKIILPHRGLQFYPEKKTERGDLINYLG